jgi:outer membrane immunogenic protein
MNSLRRALLASVSALALTTGANAADIAVKAPPLKQVETWSWTGGYIGLNGGVAWNRADFDDIGDLASNNNFFPHDTHFWSTNAAGATIGGQVGYNWQFSNFVYGLEADLNWVNGLTSATIKVGNFNPVSASTQLDWFATARARAGLAFSSTLVYATGGLAAAQFKDVWTPTTALTTEFSDQVTRTGWVAGGGVEQMIMRNLTIKAEALYANFGSWIANGPPGSVGSYRSQFTHSVTTVRGGLNWKW